MEREPYQYSTDGESYTSFNEFFGLNSGVYEVIVQDANGCEQVIEVNVPDASPMLVNLGQDTSIRLGDSIALDVILDNVLLDTFYWSTLNTTSLNPFVRPFQTSSYEITVIDENGCVETDEIVVRVVKERPVFLPNVFTPNGDGFNDVVIVQGGNDIEMVNSFQIFNRWGEKVHESRTFAPGTYDMGWDGTLNGETLNPGVFVYVVEVLFIDGRVEMYTGDITLTR